jgi:hypothetical protein
MPYKDAGKQKAAQARHYQENRSVYDARKTANRVEQRLVNVAYMKSAKGAPCLDCQIEYPYYVMQFDHIRGTKKGNVASMAHQGVALSTLQSEIAKCELVCANCHAERTFRRKDVDAGKVISD